MDCSQAGNIRNNMLWYLQKRGGGLTLIASVYINSEARLEESVKGRFVVTRTMENKKSTLEIHMVKREDGAVYFCGATDGAQRCRLRRRPYTKFHAPVSKAPAEGCRSFEEVAEEFYQNAAWIKGFQLQRTIRVGTEVYLDRCSRVQRIYAERFLDSQGPVAHRRFESLPGHERPELQVFGGGEGWERLIRSPPLSCDSLRTETRLVFERSLIAVNQQEAYFGSGTKLVVLDPKLKLRSPEVTILQPSTQEINSKGKATVVCLITDFYPDNINIHWFIDDFKQSKDVANIQMDPSSQSDDGGITFSISSRIRLDARDYAKAKQVVCVVDHYKNGSIPQTKRVTYNIKQETCGINKEAKTQAMEAGKLTYMILICKSILYGIIASVLACKGKTSSNKRFD
ncbi:uncharacterized protein LOC129712847 [Leucoraja erinacea]|uniref:uncharacterized protein LOC129712847 n=1 Tax=Leucoraja erinaceus TaxID=7782 RepID=UPI002455001B|nr:uncharacterized protein LOC129712847 [Leucoraja erinacea]